MILKVRDNIGNVSKWIARFLLLMSVAALIWRQNRIITFGLAIPTIKISDLAIALSLVFTVLALAVSPEVRKNIARNDAAVAWGRYIAALFGLMAIGSWVFSHWIASRVNADDFLGYVRIGVSVTAFMLIIFWGFHDKRYVKWLFFAFFSSVFLIPLLAAPQELMLLWFLVSSPSSYTLSAFQPGPIILASLLIIPIAFLFSLVFVPTPSKKSAVSSLFLIPLVSLELWTGSRSGWIAALIAMIAIVILKGIEEKTAKTFMLGFVTILLIFVSAFFILPSPAKNTVLLRIFPHTKSGVLYDPALLTRISTEELLKSMKFETDIQFAAGRGSIWKSYARHVLYNPLGLGPGYSSVFNEKNAGGHGVNAHNTFIEVAASGGIAALVIFSLLLFRVFKSLRELLMRRNDFFVLGLAGAFSGILVSILFFDSFSFRWLWMLLALIIVAHHNEFTDRKIDEAKEEGIP